MTTTKYNELMSLFQSNALTLKSTKLNEIRAEAKKVFEEIGFPTGKEEKWRKTKLKNVLELPYEINLDGKDRTDPLKSIFECEINNFDTDLFTILNGWHEDKSDIREDGVIITSILKAEQEYPELFYKYFGKQVNTNQNGLLALNTSSFTDGYFIYIPDNVNHDRTVQIVNLINSKTRIFVNTRNLVVLGKNAKLSLVHCDDSLSSFGSFVNTVTEFFVDEGAKLDFYKLQNKDDQATVITHNFVDQQKDSTTRSNTTTFNGGIIRNDTHVTLSGQGAHADVLGLYLVDRKQLVDNQVKIDHAVSDCTSNQLFKGIADEEARAIFNGHILVRKDAQRTSAFQNNRSIQLTDTAGIDTQPFLEIYADDVKCSHGATVGQLDEEAMFYMRQRGICERTSRMLLMFSFVGEVIDMIEIPALKERVSDLTSRRLKGELSACENCALSCEDPDKVVSFEIDMSKI
jgi:Fe-S cluster assembly protein SufD